MNMAGCLEKLEATAPNVLVSLELHATLWDLHAFFLGARNKRENFPRIRRRGERSNETPIGDVRKNSRSQDNKVTSPKGSQPEGEQNDANVRGAHKFDVSCCKS